MTNNQTDWKELCAQLYAALEAHSTTWDDEVLLDRVGTALRLAQPEPEGPTDEELRQLWRELYAHQRIRFHDGPTSGDVVEIARAVLARWGSQPIEPVPVSERPWEREGWCDGNGWCWWFDADDTGWVFDQPQFSIWTHCLPAHALPRPVPTQHGCTQRR